MVIIKLKIFDTDIGKVGVLICYDVGFPERPETVVDKGMPLLLVPFLTDTKNDHLQIMNKYKKTFGLS